MTKRRRIEVTTLNEFIALAHKHHYLTVSKEYGMLAQHGTTLTGKFLMEGPHGPLEKPDGWIEVEVAALDHDAVEQKHRVIISDLLASLHDNIVHWRLMARPITSVHRGVVFADDRKRMALWSYSKSPELIAMAAATQQVLLFTPDCLLLYSREENRYTQQLNYRDIPCHDLMWLARLVNFSDFKLLEAG